MHPPLRHFLEDRLGGYAIDSANMDRHETPVDIEGRLTADAFATDAGASLRMQVLRISAGACMEPTAGGVSLTVVGRFSADEMDRWRSGRIVRTTATLRRPAKYLDHGVPDLERMMARRGIALVGTVKSAALVEVVENGRWLDEAAASIRAAVRHALNRHVGVRDTQSAAVAVAILIGDRGGLDPLVEQRLQEAGTYHVIAISGGNIAILAGWSWVPCGSSGCAAPGRRRPRWRCWLPMPTLPAGAHPWFARRSWLSSILHFAPSIKELRLSMPCRSPSWPC